MDKIFDDAIDDHVRAYVVYGKTADKKLYVDKEMKTTQATKAEVEDAFKKGALLIVAGSDYLKAVSMTGTTVKTVAMGSSAVELTSWTVAAE